MSAPAAGLLDTSVFIAGESGRTLGTLPGRVAVSVVTIAELQLGVLATADPDTRARRADTLALARTADPLPISEAVMVSWARLVNDCRAARIHRTVKLTVHSSPRPSNTACPWSRRTTTSPSSRAHPPLTVSCV